MRSATNGRFAFGIRAGLIVVVLLPMIVLVVGSASTVSSARDIRDASTETAAVSESVRGLASAQSEVAGERYWAGAMAALRSFGLSEEDVAENLGFQMRDRFNEAAARVDTAFDAADLDQMSTRLDEARTLEPEGASSADVVDAYLRIEQLISERVTDTLAELSALERRTDLGADVADAARSLSLTVDIEAQVTDMASNLFAVKYPGQSGSATPNYNIVAADSRFRYATEELSAVGGGPVATQLRELRLDPTISRFHNDIRSTVSGVIDDGSMEMTTLDGFDPDAETESFLGTITAMEAYLQLVNTAADVLIDTSAELGAEATASEDQAIRNVLIAVGFTLAVILATSRWMIRPLRELSVDAARLSQGSPPTTTRLRGPREVRDATVALRDASRQLREAEQQALMLAERRDANPGTTDNGTLGTRLTEAFTQLSDSIAEGEALRSRLDHEAHHDNLTDLANRGAVLHHLEMAISRASRSQSSLAVLFVDVDDFKRINDQHGHSAGDAVLCSLAERICSATRSGDLVGRLGGDEFVIIAEPVRDIDEALALAARVNAAASEPIVTPAATVSTTVSIGVAVSADGQLTGDELLRDADLAVYRAKADGRSRIELCDEELRAAFQHRCDTERALREAIANDELEIAYQPVIEHSTGHTAGLEALVRWPRNDGSVSTPGDFITTAERTDLIVDLDRWVLDAVLGQLTTWSAHPHLCDLSVAINLSARHVRYASISEEIVDALDAHGVAPNRLTVEVTETALLGELDHAVEQLNELREIGVGVSIDDFGTGYTSLELLRQLPVSILKLDRVFAESIGNADEESITRLIIETAHVLGLEIIAEGVETAVQADALERLGADLQQGYLHSHPMLAAELESTPQSVASSVPR